MPAKILESATEALHNLRGVARQSFKSLWHDPTIMVYPLLAFLFILFTLPTVSGLVLGLWHKVAPDTSVVNGHIPHQLRFALGFVTFTYFYSTIVATYFSCAVSAAVMAKLEGHPTSPLHGLHIMLKHFWRITRFAVVAIFFFPLAMFAQRRKLPRGIVGVLGSSFSLHTAQLAPAIIDGKIGVFETIRMSVNTLGKRWHEGLAIKICMYGAVLFLGLLTFLPELFGSEHVAWIKWVTAAFITATIWVTTKVLSAVFITALYHQASNGKDSK